MREKFRRWWPWLLAALLLLSLIPILSVGRYARAAADDYGYGIFTHQALQNGRGFLRAIWRTATGYYDSWQGTFSALALMSLTPCIWSEQAYWLTPAVMLLSLVGGTLRLSHTLCRRLAGGTGRQGLVVAIALLLPSVQCLSAPPPQLFLVEWGHLLYLHLRAVPPVCGLSGPPAAGGAPRPGGDLAPRCGSGGLSGRE